MASSRELTTQENPFVTAGRIKPAYFCDRNQEARQLIDILRGGNNLVLTSPRRLGKTGLITHCFENEAVCANYRTIYVDILPTTSLHEFVYELGRTAFDKLMPRQQRLRQRFIQMLKSVSGKLGIDPATGLPTFSLELGDIAQPEVTLKEVFNCLENTDQPCWVAIDEFQQIGQYPEKHVEALLRSYIQQTTNCRFVFAGSERHLLEEMFLASARPFYNSADLMELGPIPESTYCEFVLRLMNERSRRIAPELVERLYRLFEGNTYCLQQTFNKAFAATPKGEECTEDRLRRTLESLLDAREFSAKATLSRLTTPQKALLYAVVRDGIGRQITSADFIKRHRLTSASSVQGASRALLDKDILTESDRSYWVADPFFRLWLLRFLKGTTAF